MRTRLGLFLVFSVVLAACRPRVAPTLPLPDISRPQVYIAEIKDLDLEVLPGPDQPPRTMLGGNFTDFMPDVLLRTGKGEGYAFIGLPGRAELFMAPQSQIRFVSSDTTGVVIQLDEGRAILNLPADFPAGRSFTVLSAAGARTWISGSKMCLSYESSKELLRMDCVEDLCFYGDQKARELQAGYHVIFSGKEVTEVGLGIQPEACQFVPGVVPSSTATVTPSLTPGATTPSP